MEELVRLLFSCMGLFLLGVVIRESWIEYKELKQENS